MSLEASNAIAAVPALQLSGQSEELPRPPLPTDLPNMLPWEANGKEKIWALINAIHVPELFKVLFGTKTGENSSGLNKKAVYKILAQKIWSEYWHLGARDRERLATRTGGKLEDLISKYKEAAKLLRKTGQGLGDRNNPDDAIFNDEGNAALKFYIPKDGPAEDAAQEVQNLWDQVKKKFEFFPAFHSFCFNRANMVPPAVTTGTGPHGRTTLHLQGPPGPQSRLPVHQLPRPSMPSSSRVSPDPQIPQSNSNGAGAVRPPQNGASQGAYNFLRIANPSPITISLGSTGTRPPKRDFLDTLSDLTQRQIETSERRQQMEELNSIRLSAREDKKLLLQSVQMGLYTAAEGRTRIDEIEEKLKRAEQMALPPALQLSTPSRNHRRNVSAPPEVSPTHRSNQLQSSPTWSIEDGGSHLDDSDTEL